MAFYVFFPFLARVVTSLRRACAFLGIAIVIAAIFRFSCGLGLVDGGAQSLFYKFGLPRHLPSFALGMLMFFLHEGHGKEMPWRKLLNGTLCLVAVAIGYVAQYRAERLDIDVVLLVQNVTSAVLVWQILIWPARLFVNRVIGLCGRWSYSIYLNHAAVVFAMIPLYQWYYALGGYRAYKYVVCCAITLVPVLLLSAVTCFVVEEPGIALGKKVIRGLQRRVLQ